MENEIVDLNALLIPADPKRATRWKASASKRVKLFITVTIDADIAVLEFVEGAIRMGIRSKVVAKTALTTLYSETFEAEVFVDVTDYSPTEVNIKDGEMFSEELAV